VSDAIIIISVLVFKSFEHGGMIPVVFNRVKFLERQFAPVQSPKNNFQSFSSGSVTRRSVSLVRKCPRILIHLMSTASCVAQNVESLPGRDRRRTRQHSSSPDEYQSSHQRGLIREAIRLRRRFARKPTLASGLKPPLSKVPMRPP